MSETTDITISHNVHSVINELLTSVYLHYPVGYLEYRNFYGGYIKMEKIVSDKFNYECNDSKSTSNIFGAVLGQQWPEMKIENRNHLNFPNYNFKIHLPEFLNQDLSVNRSIEICISLICNYYTVYMISEYHLKQLESEINSPIIQPFISYSYLFGQSDKEKVILAFIHDQIAKLFPNKNFVAHDILMSHKLSGIFPFRQDIYLGAGNRYFSLLDLLFNFSDTEGVKILE